MKAPGPDDRLVDVMAYLTDEALGYDHWRAAQFSSPVADHKRPALLLVAADDGARTALRADVERMLSARDVGPLPSLDQRVLALARMSGAAERMQAAAYDLPESPLRTRLLADSVVVLQELARLMAPDSGVSNG